MTGIRIAVHELAFNVRAFAREVIVGGLALLVLAGVALAAAAGVTVRSLDSLVPSLPHSASAPPEAAPAPAPGPAPRLPTDGVEFMETVDGRPMTVACGTPSVVLYDGTGAPYDASNVVRTATGMLAEAAGVDIAFQERGIAPVPRGHVITVGWVDALTPDSGNDPSAVLGRGGPETDGSHLTGGSLVLSASAAWPDLGTAPGSEVAIALHELGHSAAGLDHDEDGQMTALASRTRAPGFSPAEAAAVHFIFTSDCSTDPTT